MVLELEFKLATAAFGGGIGAACRVLIYHWFQKQLSFPWATFGINVVGSLLLGILFVVARDRPAMLLLLGAGFCGGFTTFSTFSLEALNLLESGRWVEAAAYAQGSVIAGLMGVWLGVQIGKLI